jgi:hypothetical protein
MPTNPQSQGQVEAKRTIQMEAEVEISIKDRDVIERVTGPGGDKWRSQLYNLHADLPDDAATMQVVSFHAP